ncbi:MAG: CmpA/NrtA family ABC transporter substrate-binding protein [Myxococcales bacterium]
MSDDPRKKEAPHACAHAAPHTGTGEAEAESRAALAEEAVLRAVLPDTRTRRALLRDLGRGTLLAAIGSVLPLPTVRALAADKPGKPEKTALKLGFVPITCATPIIMAEPMGFYAREGLQVSVVKTAGWALVRDKVLAREYDASHMLSPMPLAITLGLGSQPDPTYVSAIENINGQAITLHVKHKDKRDPRKWKGMKFAVPFDYSMHNLLLRYYVAEAGLDPDKDISIRVVPPPEMVANLRAGNLDGYLAPEPFNQRAVYEEVGFIHLLSRDIWNGHPCCAFGVSDSFVKENPNTYAALFRAIASATAFAHQPKNRPDIVKAIAPANYLNQPIAVLEQVMTGRYADGLGTIQNAPDRADFDAFPWHSMAVWMLTQLQRWGYLKGEVDYKKVAEKVFLATEARTRLAAMGMEAPKTTYKRHTIMGKEFDPAKPEAYLQSFPIRKA